MSPTGRHFSGMAGLTDECRFLGVKRTHSRHRGRDAIDPISDIGDQCPTVQFDNAGRAGARLLLCFALMHIKLFLP